MRLYELAKDLDLSPKDVLGILQDAGFDVKNHMSVIPNGAAEFLEKKLKNKGSSVMPQKPRETVLKKQTDSSVKQNSSPSNQNDSPQNNPSDQQSFAPKRGVSTRPSIRYSAHSTFSPEEYIDDSGDSSAAAGGRPFRRRRSGPRRNRRQPQEHSVVRDVSEITISGGVALSELAVMMGKSAGVLILELLKKGSACGLNDIVSPERIQEIGAVLNIAVHVELPVEQGNSAQRSSAIRAQGSNLVRRWPVVVVMGHVDHGKTTLLDYLRKTSVAAKEKGGITQHLGAYEVESSHGKIVFIDTPGHAAFTSIRDRGVSVTDLVVLIVAIDDGVKPQTIEALQQAQNAKLPIIVAINKIDKAHTDDDFDRIKRQLAEHGLLAEDWGGDTVMVGISAKSGNGVNELLEMIVLQTQLMDLFADVTVPAQLFVLESRVDRGFGPLATVIPLCGTLRTGDCFASNTVTGKVRLLLKPNGDKVAEVGPSIPVQVVGCNALPEPGEVLTVVTSDEFARVKNAQSRKFSMTAQADTSQEDDTTGELVKIIVKTDAQGSADAIFKLTAQMSAKDEMMRKRLRIISCSVGDVTESDVMRAADTGAYIIAFTSRVDRNAAEMAQSKKVTIKYFDIIYRLTEHLEEEIIRTKRAIKVLKRTGKLEVRKTFVLKDQGIIAGCYVVEGSIFRTGRVVCMRGKQKIGEDEITSLQRDKKTAKEIAAGYECAFMCKNFNDWQVGDMVECFVEEIQQ